MARGKRGRPAREDDSEDEVADVAEERGKADQAKAEIEEDEAAGRRELLVSQCQSVLNILMNQRHSWLFNEPVDPVNLEIPDYPTIVKHPMDLGTIHSKLEKREYTELPTEFSRDVRLTFENAMLYNPPGHEVHNFAKKLLALFEKEESKALNNPALTTPPPPRKPSSPLSLSSLSFEKKQKMLEDLQRLPAHMQHEAVALLMKDKSAHVDWGSDEVNVQLDFMDGRTVQELDDYVKKCLRSAENQGKETPENNKAHSKAKKQRGRVKVAEEEEDEYGIVIDVPLTMFSAQDAK